MEDQEKQELDQLGIAQELIIKRLNAMKYGPIIPPTDLDKPRATRHSETMKGYETLRQLSRPNFMPAKGTTFEDLGKYLIDDGARHVQGYLMTLIAKGQDEAYFEAYMKLLQYFRPKVMAHAIKQQTEVIFRFDPGDQDLIEDI